MEVFFPESNLLGKLAGRSGDGRILLVTGPQLYEICGVAGELAGILGERGFLRLSDFSPNPSVECFQRLHREIRSAGLDGFSAILAIGGGTSIDLAKLVKAFAWQEAFVAADLGRELGRVWEVPLLAVPTTAGSGSEATHFAVIYDGHEKHSVADERLRPDYVFLEPRLLRSLPAEEAAAGGLDALCQGIESFWSVGATGPSRALAAEAVGLAWENLEAFVIERDAASMDAMARAAHLAGRAIDITKTTAPHAVSYPLTSGFGVRHGHAVALMLAAMLPFNAAAESAEVRRVVGEVCSMLGVENADAREAAERLLRMVRRLGLPTELADLGICNDGDLEFILDHGFNPERVGNNPRVLSR